MANFEYLINAKKRTSGSFKITYNDGTVFTADFTADSSRYFDVWTRDTQIVRDNAISLRPNQSQKVMVLGTDASNVTTSNKDDILWVGNRSASVTARMGRGNDLAVGGVNTDFLYGGEGDDDLFGNAGDDFLDGGAGNDELDGGQGDDTLNGGKGDDTLRGGSGNDRFILSPQDYDLGAVYTDTIVDFSRGDKIDLTAFSPKKFGAIGGDSIWITESFRKNAMINIDMNGDGNADLILDIRGLSRNELVNNLQSYVLYKGGQIG